MTETFAGIIFITEDLLDCFSFFGGPGSKSTTRSRKFPDGRKKKTAETRSYYIPTYMEVPTGTCRKGFNEASSLRMAVDI